MEIEAIAAATVADARRAGIRVNPGALPPDPSHTLPQTQTGILQEPGFARVRQGTNPGAAYVV